MSRLAGAVPASAGSVPPATYVAGIGRGATPFSTRADLGLQGGIKKVKSNNDPFGIAPVGYIPGRGRGATGFAGGVSRDDTVDDRDRGDYSEANYDEFSGYSEALFKDAEYDEEDRQADAIYDSIEARMDTRRKSRRETKLKEELAKIRAQKPTVQQQFSDVKRGLANVSVEEWDAIPSIGDFSAKQKQKKRQNSMPAPDSLLIAPHMMNAHMNTVQRGYGMQTPLYSSGLSTPLGLRTPIGLQTPLGLQTPMGLMTPMGNLTPSLNDLGEARGTVLSVKLDKVMDNLSGQTVIDPKGYLTDLNSMQLRSDADIADIKKARTLLKSVITTNPKHSPGWIAACRLEELAGKLQNARGLIAEGCKHCPKSEDIWLEAARLENPLNAKAVLAKAVDELPNSVRLWLDAYNRENDKNDKRRVLRKALEFVPNSVRLWKEAVSLEDEKNARILLSRAVECVPQSVDMWLALARLSTYQEAQKVLNEARKKVPTSAEIWVSACKLEETSGNDKMVDAIISRGIENLGAKGVHHERSSWLKLAEESESSGYLKTCQAIIKATMKVGVENVNMKRIWKDDAESCLSKGSIETARNLYNYALQYLKTSKSLWLALADLETKHGTHESLDRVLQRAVSYCPTAEVLWLMAAKQKWLHGDVPAARRILAEAFSHNENTEAISLAAVKLERDNKEFRRARKLLQRARFQCNTPKIWMQSIQLERQLNKYENAILLVSEALQKHEKFDKLWMIGGQLHLESDPPDYDKALEIFDNGLKVCPNSVELWLCAVDAYRLQKNWTKARATLERARLRNDKQQLLWLAAIQIELETSNVKNANFILSRALQDCPTSGILWAEAIAMEVPARQKAKSHEALEKCGNDAYVVLSVSCLFWRNHQTAHARKWFNRTVTLNPSLGDAWGAYFAFEAENGDEELQIDIINRTIEAEPNQGLKWNKLVKQVKNWRLKFQMKLKKYVEQYFPDVLTKISERVNEFLIGKADVKTENAAEKESISTTNAEESSSAETTGGTETNTSPSVFTSSSSFIKASEDNVSVKNEESKESDFAVKTEVEGN